ncbi:hypothetical protein [Serinibacter salmoneus]|uniref:Uncharacterized protein n=1 Tax=Serinibacter salmoneus TaxID=556530 RepID=A0A2A9D676_9MICO|nr:hypothetical protein [Serinibacter salmoneus]PFG21339.1 hypothetical protein ATL40_2968 [Serinibacter salmoneus]
MRHHGRLVLVQLLDRGVLTALVDQAGTVLATPETPAEAWQRWWTSPVQPPRPSRPRCRDGRT